MNVGDAVVCTPFMTSLHHENSRIPHFGLSLFSPTPAFYKFSVYILLNEIIKVNYPTTIFMQFFLTLLGIYSNPSQQDFPSIPQYNKAKSQSIIKQSNYLSSPLYPPLLFLLLLLSSSVHRPLRTHHLDSYASPSFLRYLLCLFRS